VAGHVARGPGDEGRGQPQVDAGGPGREHADAAAGRSRRGAPGRGRTLERSGGRRYRRPPAGRGADRPHHQPTRPDHEAPGRAPVSRTRVPAVDGWFPPDEWAPALLGARGTVSGSYFWPTAVATSGNPVASGEEREPVELSRTGRLWSWTTNHY